MLEPGVRGSIPSPCKNLVLHNTPWPQTLTLNKEGLFLYRCADASQVS